LLGGAISFGFGAGALVGGVTSSRFGYGYAFDVAALLTLVPYPLYTLVKKRSPGHLKPAVAQPPASEGSQGLDWRTLSILSVASVPLFMGVVFYTSIMQLVVTQTASIGASSVDASIMISLYSFSNVLFQPLLGAAFGRRARSSIALGLALNLGVFLALTRTGTMLGFDALAVAAAFCFSMVSPLSLSLLMVRTPRRYAGRMMGMYGAAEDVGIVLGPVLGAFFWANFGLESAYLSMALPTLAALIFYLLMFNRAGKG
ncbi:MAG: MFS transporter, partial [Candidatus Gagatemarchaeaceae archaeon]